MTDHKSPAPAPLQPTPITLPEEPYIFTTVRYQPDLTTSASNTAASCRQPNPFYMLEHHYTRLQVAKWSVTSYQHDRPSTPSGPNELYLGLLNSVNQFRSSHPEQPAPTALRIRLRAHAGGRIVTETFSPLLPLPHTSLFPSTFSTPDTLPAAQCTVYLDVVPTTACEATMFKTSDRALYTRAREAVGLGAAGGVGMDEVLLWDGRGEVMDGSASTPYFFRGGRWVTPGGAVGGLQGTTRRWALENGLCVEGTVERESLVEGEKVWLSNAVKGYYLARYTAKRKDEDDG